MLGCNAMPLSVSGFRFKPEVFFFSIKYTMFQETLENNWRKTEIEMTLYTLRK